MKNLQELRKKLNFAERKSNKEAYSHNSASDLAGSELLPLDQLSFYGGLIFFSSMVTSPFLTFLLTIFRNFWCHRQQENLYIQLLHNNKKPPL